MSCLTRFTLIFIFVALSISSFSQEKCGTVRYEEIRQLKNPNKETKDQFENWMQQGLSLRQFQTQRTERTKATYTIPVVVHIIHYGEPVGTGTNISDAQIQSQISVLNKDFQRLNSDANLTPAEFLPVAGSIDIQFVLAKQDPLGAPTNGIVRVLGTQTGWTINENNIFKSLSYWPAENYLNIWVVKFNDNTFGYAQFPVSSLPGLEGSPNDRLTDGVAINYLAFGSADDGTFNLNANLNKGRTTTHEVGHFLGLRHIWGDDSGSCSGTDYVDDTPNQADNYDTQCPTGTKTSCNSSDMYMNYMDYTNDACMNLFTAGQVGRFNVVLQNSPRRVSLLSSPGASDPIPANIDAAISKVISPGTGNCGTEITPTLEIQNIGLNTITSLRVQLKVNNTIIETKDFNINLNYLQKGEIAFSHYLPSVTVLNFNYEILLVNGATDERPVNNSQLITTTTPDLVSLPLTEVFNSIPSSWKIENPDNLKTWQITSTISNGNALYVNCFDYDNQGARDRLITPVIDLTNEPVALLKFDRAYAPYSNQYYEGLRVYVSVLCDFDNSAVEVLSLSGTDLATAPATTNFFSPTSSQWKTTTVSLNQFLGSRIQIAFESLNGYGNNLYLDNIVVLSDQLTDLALLSLENPSPVSCENTITPKIKVKNQGTTDITNFKVETIFNNQTNTQSISDILVQPGIEQIISLNSMTLLNGLNNISITVKEPNLLIDENPNNDNIIATRIINKEEDHIPYRQNFDDSYSTQWSIVSQDSELEWTDKSTNYNNSLLFNAYNYYGIGDESWLVSPIMDFSKNVKASLFFDISYAYNGTNAEEFKILYSDNCGISFDNQLYIRSGSSLATTTGSIEWEPSLEGDWRKDYISLDGLTGKSNLRFAFVAKANKGNNLYLDNIEFFIDDDQFPVKINDQFSVYGAIDDIRVTFNLDTRELVYLQIYNTIGQLVLNNELPETLNQTYFFNLGHLNSGIYIFRILTSNKVGATKVFLGRQN
jgi:hypothetical protein